MESRDEFGSGPGMFRNVVKACFEWLYQWRRVRYAKRSDIHQAVLNLACAMNCRRKLEA